MNVIQHRGMQLACALALSGLSLAAQAVALTPPVFPAPFADTALPGTTVAARPELAGMVLVDDITPFSFAGLSGTVQNRVVKETSTGTLDFYWKINLDSGPAAAPGQITAFRLGQFGDGYITDGDWRIDGLGQAAPSVGRVFAQPGGYINFLFDADAIDVSESSKFFFLHTNATAYAKTASFDLLCGPSNCTSGQYATFAPAVPEPSGIMLTVAGLLAAGAILRRRKAA